MENQDKVATIRDPQLKKEKMQKLVEYLNNYLGYGRERQGLFEIAEDANGPVLILHAPIDYNRDLPPEYRYENSYYLESDYPKTGLAFMEDGKYGLLPVKHDYRNTEMVYDTPQKLINGLLSANPQLSSEQIGVTPEGVIQITGMINDLKMPTYSLNYNRQTGVIEDANSRYGVGFHVEMVNAHETSLNAMGSSTGEQKRMAEQSNYYSATREGGNEVADAYKPGYYNESANSSGVEAHAAHVNLNRSLFNFAYMKDVNSKYFLNAEHEVKYREAENASQSLNLRDPQGDKETLKETLELNRIWIDAFNEATGAYADTNRQGIVDNPAAFDGRAGEMFGALTEIANQSRSISEVVDKLYELYPDATKTVALNVLIIFISNENVREVFDLEPDLSPSEAMQRLNSMQNDHLRDEAEDTMEMVMNRFPRP